MEIYKRFKLEQWALKLYVALSGVGMTCYCIMLCFGFRHCIAEFISLTFSYLLLCSAVWMFKLCWLSWAFLTYCFAIRVCIILYELGVFGEYIDIAHYIATGVGIALSVFFLCNSQKYLACKSGYRYEEQK